LETNLKICHGFYAVFLGAKMNRLILVALLALFAAHPSSAFAQAQGGAKKYKRTCQEICAERCPTASFKNACFAECPNKCEMGRRDGSFRK